MRRRARRSAAARGGSSPALPLGGVPGHQHDHRLAQNVEGTHAHVTEGSRGAIVPRRGPAPKGGGAAAPASSWRRLNAQDKGITSGGYRSQFKGEAGELEGEGDATAVELGNSGGSGGAPVWSGRGSYGPGDENL
jgi:hypothetical protein